MAAVDSGQWSEKSNAFGVSNKSKENEIASVSVSLPRQAAATIRELYFEKQLNG